MVFKSDLIEFKKYYPNENISNFNIIYHLDNGIETAFVIFLNDNEYPIVYKNNYPADLLEKEVIDIIEELYGSTQINYIQRDKADNSSSNEKLLIKKIHSHKISIFICNSIMALFLILFVHIVFKLFI